MNETLYFYIIKLVGKLFCCVDIDSECKNISISADIGGNIVHQIGRIHDTEVVSVLAYPPTADRK